jgi:Ca2+-binding RTX toxin-like protein
MDVAEIERFGDNIEITFTDGSEEEIENGFFERKNANGETVEERSATAEDLARLTLLADQFESTLPPLSGVVVKVERGPASLEITYSDGSKEEIEGSTYEREGAGGIDQVERAATSADIDRLNALADDFAVSGGVIGFDDSDGRPGKGKGRDKDDDDRGHGRRDGDRNDDKIAGDDRHEKIHGRGGDDKIRGGDGDDSIKGGSGKDFLRGDKGDDDVRGNGGGDRLFGNKGDDALTGNAGNDRLKGGAGNDTLDGGLGNDRLIGNGGADVMSGGEGNDRLKGNGGDDILSGDAGDDRVKGNGGDDIVLGGDGDDRVSGGGGSDIVDGGNGSDRYHGNGGADTFVFGVDGEFDKIHDFQDGVDQINLSAFALSGIDDVLAGSTQDGEDVFVDLGGGDVIKIDNFNLSQITVDDFVF